MDQMTEQFWELVREVGGQGARNALPPFIAYAVTTGDAPTTDTVGSVTTSEVTVWLNGIAQTAENKTRVVLPYGQAAPGAGELWLVILPNFRGPGVLLLRVA